MRTLTEDLKNRLAKIVEERKKLTQRLDQINDVERALVLLIKEEDINTKATQLSLLPINSVNGHKVIGRTEISQFIAKALADGKPKSLKELTLMAKNEKIDFHKKSPGRVIHFALIGLKRNNYTSMIQKGIWQLTEKAIGKGEVGKKSEN